MFLYLSDALTNTYILSKYGYFQKNPWNLALWHFFFLKKCMSHIYMSHTGIFFVAKWQKFAKKYTYTISF